MDRKHCIIKIVYKNDNIEEFECVDWWWQDDTFVIITSGDPTDGGGSRVYIDKKNTNEIRIFELNSYKNIP